MSAVEKVHSLQDLDPAAQACRVLRRHMWPRPDRFPTHRALTRLEVTERRPGSDRVLAATKWETCAARCGTIRTEHLRINGLGRLVREPGTRLVYLRTRPYELAAGVQIDPDDVETLADAMLHTMYVGLDW